MHACVVDVVGTRYRIVYSFVVSLRAFRNIVYALLAVYGFLSLSISLSLLLSSTIPPCQTFKSRAIKYIQTSFVFFFVEHLK